jgi:Tfp pilus assembly protein PilE
MFNYIVKIVKLKAVNTIKAISLIEIIVAISIVFVLSAMSIYSYQDYKIKALFNSAFATAEQNKLAISNYYAKNKTCPTTTFITQTLASTCTAYTPCSIDNTANSTGYGTAGCNLNIKNTNGNSIVYFIAQLSSLGEFQYFCLLDPANGPPTKYLSISCPGLPSSGFNNP